MFTASLICLFVTLGISLFIIRERKNVARLIHQHKFVPDLGAMHLIERFGKSVSEITPASDAKKHQEQLIEEFGRPVSGGEPASLASIPNTNISASRSKHSRKGAYTAMEDAYTAMEDVSAAIEGAAQGTLFSMDAIQNLMEIDEHVYIAMGTLAGEQFDTIGDLSKSLANWESSEIGEPLPPAAASKLMGHLSEPVVADNLRELGYQVQLPDVSNQEGYDLILNGEYFVNVKTVADAGSLAGHFDKYPDIPVIVPGDMTGIPEDAIYLGAENSADQFEEAIHEGREHIVLVDNELSHADMVQHTESVSDALLGNIDLVGGGIPMITLAASSWREIRLLVAKDTDLLHSAKNLGLDVSTTAISNFAGLGAGSAIGTLILPGIGTTIGAIAGLISFSIAGRAASNKLKKIPLKKAIRRYEKTREKKIEALEEKSRKQFHSLVQNQSRRLAEIAKTHKDELGEKCNHIVNQRQEIFRISYNEAQEQLKLALIQLNDRRSFIETIFRWKYLVLTVTQRNSLRELIAQLNQRIRHIESELARITETTLEMDLIGDRTIPIFQSMLCTEEGVDFVKYKLGLFEKRRQHLENSWQEFITQQREHLIRSRYECMKQLSVKTKKIKDKVNQEIQAIREELEPLMEKIKIEKKKIGK